MVMEKERRPEMLRRLAAFVLAAAVMVAAGSAAHSFFVQEAWSMAAGQADGTAALVAIPFADRLSWAAHDLGGMIRPYGALTSIALLIALLIAGAVAKFTGFRSIVFAVAGALAIFTLFTTLRMVLGTVGIFGARGTAGLAAQMAVGLAAGVLFAQLTRPHKS
jgi:hypothetical protein